jgi:hypothetical protein
MSATLTIGLLCQAIALALLIGRLGGRLVDHIGAVFAVVAIIWHGGDEILNILAPGSDPYRSLVTRSQVDAWVFVVGPAILLYVCVYLCILGRRPDEPDPAMAAVSARYLDWRILAVPTIVLAALTVTGSGFASSGSATGFGQNAYWSVGLSYQFLFIGVALTASSFVAVRGKKMFLPVFAIEIGVLALAGERIQIVGVTVMTIYLLRRYCVPVGSRSIATAVALAVIVVLAIGAGRLILGRTDFAHNHGPAARLGAVWQGLVHITHQSSAPGARETYTSRIDGNAFAALEFDALQHGQPPVGFTPIKNTLTLAVPSFLNPTKVPLSTERDRNEVAYASGQFGIFEEPGSWLPTQLGTAVAYYGVVGLYLIVATLGMLLALVDRWLSRTVTPIRIVVAAGLLSTYVIYYEQPFVSAYLITDRGVIGILMVLGCLRVVGFYPTTGVGKSRWDVLQPTSARS